MSVLIKGMKMPEDNCETIQQITITNNWVDGEIKMLAHDSITNEFIGEVVEMPELHGRLIDADYVLSKLYKKELEFTEEIEWIRACIALLKHAPTVIEAEGTTMTIEETISKLEEIFEEYHKLHENTNGNCGYEEMKALNMALVTLRRHGSYTQMEDTKERAGK